MEHTAKRTDVRRRSRRRRKTNIFTAYFKDFGLRQITGLLMLACVITIIVGLAVPSFVTLTVGISVYMVAAALGILQPILVMIKSHKRSPEFKRAVVNLIIMSVIFLLALSALIFLQLNGLYA